VTPSSDQPRHGPQDAPEPWAVGYNNWPSRSPPAFLEPDGFTLSSAVAALSMSGSSIIVAVNAIALKRLRLPAPQDVQARGDRGGLSEAYAR
jgi:Cu2+-exporting ATPase